MKRRLVILSVVLVVGILLTISASAHTPLLSVEDNEDGTIYLEGGFSDGSSAAGVTILLVEEKPYEGDPKGKDLFEGELVLLRTKMDEYSELTLDKPNIPYFVIFDAGPGHVVKKEGPPLGADEKRESPLLLVQKKEDGKIYLKSEFSDRSAVGFSILLVEDKVYQGDKEGKKFYQEKLILLEEKLDKNGELTVVEPEVAYFIVLDVPGYVTEIKGL